ncbi:hypothetical protein EPC75_07065 [Helicobacter pylori]|nr:hypothetical protein EPC73_08065 [Helicobacter pylori]KAA6504235.1 hypothetical protein EPC78_04210 [Helicobacter pylori]KAA6516932.1 hypothetical protein EPC75_07065 [Helicobacter pylori]
MYLEHYSIKAFFFFCHFLKNVVIFLILTLFVSFGMLWWCDLVVRSERMVAENGFEPLTFGL